MKIIERLPPRNILLLIVLFSLINPLHYAIMSLTAPPGKVFMSYVDDAFQLALMKSVIWGFQSPWDYGISVFENPFLGASYTFVFLGTVPALLNLSMLLFFIFIKFSLSVIYLILVYRLIRYFLETEKAAQTAYLLFLFSAGIGAFLYAFTVLFFPHYSTIIGYAFTNEFDELGSGVHSLSHLTRIYWILPEITGLLSLLFLMTNRNILSGLFLGLTVLFYPTFAIAFSFIIFVYLVIKSYEKGSFLALIKTLLPVVLTSAIFAIPWVVNYLKSPYYFDQYKLWFSGLPMVTILISLFFTLIFSIYGMYRSTNSVLKKKLYILAVVFFGTLSSLLHIYEFAGGSQTLMEWLSTSNLLQFSKLLQSNAIFIDLPLLFLFGLLFFDILRKDIHEKYKFALLWSIAIISITFISAQFVFWWPARMRWFLLIPLCIAAVPGIKYLSSTKITLFKHEIILKEKTILILIILLSLPSLLAFNVYMQQVAHSSDLVYISEQDFSALEFLKSQPDGRVLSFYQIGNNIPFFTDKKAVLFNGGEDERQADVARFYSDSSQEEKLSILKKYQVSYVFLGDNEKRTAGNLDNLPFLKIIFDNETRVYSATY